MGAPPTPVMGALKPCPKPLESPLRPTVHGEPMALRCPRGPCSREVWYLCVPKSIGICARVRRDRSLGDGKGPGSSPAVRARSPSAAPFRYHLGANRYDHVPEPDRVRTAPFAGEGET